MTQWFGRGFGHIGFTSNLGACPPAAAATARFWSTMEPTPSAATTATRPAPTLSLCVITDLPFVQYCRSWSLEPWLLYTILFAGASTLSGASGETRQRARARLRLLISIAG